MKKKKTKPKYYWFWGVLLLILVGGVVWSYRSNFAVRDIKFAVAQTGTITHERKVPATYANQELPVIAPFSGTIQFIGNDGQRFRRGETLATLQQNGAAPGSKQGSAANTAITAGMGGLFFHQSDGLETIMTSDNLMSMDLEKLVAQTSVVKTTGQTVQEGEVVGKIVNNLMPTMAFLQLQSIDDLTGGKTLSLTVGNQTMNAKIMRKSEKPMGIVVQFPHYVDGSASNRHQEVIWNYSPQTSGVLVPKSALWTQGEELGIFVVNEGVVHFKKVKVLDEDDQQACIDNLPNGIPVVTNPRDGLEGLIAKVKNI
ncbi:HlyD family efflux transporter periplasmic adaptor subunit [Desulfosporosinus sp. PR]|uniref:HlyD family efflux transporter periplasmic adaptor subunit n=1 Tax=Candidatus Desulfosporosinus nitrosoreducens TaxID=3401928 RepID=UPI0027FBAAE6|nr:HlyD family efflux transporter periplasmic adaptor subunit [Desulfosporosinus sp. PR]MDQ7096147.1 HlyD family efflux transporter periplasmic adaptor subunit [Desulfosporosinus sp. PR]